MAISIKAGGNQDVDIYYSSDDGYVVMSAIGRNGMTRETFFKVGSSIDLNDGINSPAKDGNWVTKVLDTETNYIFLYDADGHYSKFIIVDQDGGEPGVPSELTVKWLYNEKQNDINF